MLRPGGAAQTSTPAKSYRFGKLLQTADSATMRSSFAENIGMLRHPSELLGVMQSFSQGLHNQTDQRIRNGIRY